MLIGCTLAMAMVPAMWNKNLALWVLSMELYLVFWPAIRLGTGWLCSGAYCSSDHRESSLLSVFVWAVAAVQSDSGLFQANALWRGTVMGPAMFLRKRFSGIAPDVRYGFRNPNLLVGSGRRRGTRCLR